MILDGAARQLGDPGEVADALGVLGVDRGVPICSACSGVVVEGRVNEEEGVLVVNGKCESSKV